MEGRRDMEYKKELSGVKRREQIIDDLREYGEVAVKILAEKFGVSEMTIRRDLHFLEEQGYVTIHYGGAMLLDRQNNRCQSFSLRKGKESENKRRIARKAASYIKEGDVLFMDTSTTVLEILTYMPAIRVTIITNSMPVMEATYRDENINLYMAPGLYRSIGGPLDYATAEYLSRFHYDKAFFGSASFDPDFGASAAEEIESAVKKCVLVNADESYLLIDHSKMGKKGFMKCSDTSDYTGILSDEELDMDWRTKIARNGGKLILC